MAVIKMSYKTFQYYLSKFLQEEMEKVKVYFTELHQEEIMEIMKQELTRLQGMKRKYGMKVLSMFRWNILICCLPKMGKYTP